MLIFQVSSVFHTCVYGYIHSEKRHGCNNKKQHSVQATYTNMKEDQINGTPGTSPWKQVAFGN